MVNDCSYSFRIRSAAVVHLFGRNRSLTYEVRDLDLTLHITALGYWELANRTSYRSYSALSDGYAYSACVHEIEGCQLGPAPRTLFDEHHSAVFGKSFNKYTSNIRTSIYTIISAKCNAVLPRCLSACRRTVHMFVVGRFQFLCPLSTIRKG